MAANILARQWTGRARARLEERTNGGRCGHEPGRMEPEGPRLENTPIEWREAAAAANCGQHKTRYIPTWNVKLYKSIDNYRK